MKTISENRAFGGTQGVYSHDSETTGTLMTFAVFVPEHEAGTKLPVLFYLSGLTCTHANVMEKGEYRRACAEHGILFVSDEVQSGFGRTGKLFAIEHYDVQPDIMTVAKSLGGGLFPNAAVLHRKTPVLTEFVDRHPRFHATYGGGSDLGCCVSLRVLEYIEEHRVCPSCLSDLTLQAAEDSMDF